MFGRTFKAADVEEFAGINAGTLRVYRGHGLLKDMGFETDGTISRFSFADLIVFGIAAHLRDTVPMKEKDAMIGAMALRKDVQNIIANGRQDVWAFISYSGEKSIIKYIIDMTPGTKIDWADLYSVCGFSRAAIMIGLSDIAREIWRRVKDADEVLNDADDHGWDADDHGWGEVIAEFNKGHGF